MTPLQMAVAECANYDNGACDSMRFDEKLKPLPGKALDRCLLTADKRCDYFEECVMPMAAMVSDPAKSKSYMSAAENYRYLHKIQGGATIIRVCPGCDGELLPRKRFCPSCVVKRRKSTWRKSQNAKRQNACQHVNS